jgi:hypothetical protein
MAERDWDAEIDRWTERFRDVPDPPEPFARALREGWDPAERERLAADADAYTRQTEGFLAQVGAAGWDLVRFDAKSGSCGVCVKYVGKAYSLRGEHPELPPPPPLPICPACRHTLNLLTPFFLQSTGLDVDDLADEAQPFVDGDV